MKIKIPPYPNYQITDQSYDRDVVSNSIVKNDVSDLVPFLGVFFVMLYSKLLTKNLSDYPSRSAVLRR